MLPSPSPAELPARIEPALRSIDYPNRSDLFPGFLLPTDPILAAEYELHIAAVHLRSCQGERDDATDEYDGTVAAWRRAFRTAKALRVASRKWREALRRQRAVKASLRAARAA